MAQEHPNIKKQDGTLEPFDPWKLRSSLRRAGASPQVCDDIVAHIETEIREGDSTSTIYTHAFSLLKKREAQLPAARYSMKRAIQELGPSGFPFEDFVAEIFTARGYRTETGKELSGTCAVHEIDLIAEKGNERIGAEIKFHGSLGIRSDLKVTLYVDARFEDLKPRYVTEAWLITNTRFTSNALTYGACRGLTMISWSYPKGGCLQDLIEEAGVQPITALTTLSRREKRMLLDAGVVLCRSLEKSPSVLDSVVAKSKRERVLAESTALCGSGKKV